MLEISFTQKILLCVARKTANWYLGKFIKRLVNRIYLSIDMSKVFREVFDSAYDSVYPNEPDKSKNRNKVGIEYLGYMFKGNISYRGLSPETLAVHHKFEEILAKNYPYALQYFEAHKNDLRGDRLENKLDNIAAALGIERVTISVSFDDGQTETTIQPSFIRKHYVAKQSSSIPQTQHMFVTGIANSLNFVQQVANLYGTMNTVTAKITPIKGKRNNSFCPIKFSLSNDGKHQIENVSLIISFEEGVEIKRSNETSTLFSPLLMPNQTTSIYEDTNEVFIRLSRLLPARVYTSDDVFVKIPCDKTEVKVSWDFSSSHYVEKGELRLKSHPTIKDEIIQTEVTILPKDEVVDDLEDIA